MFVAERLQFLLHAASVSGKYPLTEALTDPNCFHLLSVVLQSCVPVSAESESEAVVFNAVGWTVKHGLTVTLTTQTHNRCSSIKISSSRIVGHVSASIFAQA